MKTLWRGEYYRLTSMLICFTVFGCCLQFGREVLDEAAKVIAVGVTTEEIDRVVHEVRK